MLLCGQSSCGCCQCFTAKWWMSFLLICLVFLDAFMMNQSVFSNWTFSLRTNSSSKSHLRKAQTAALFHAGNSQSDQPAIESLIYPAERASLWVRLAADGWEMRPGSQAAYLDRERSGWAVRIGLGSLASGFWLSSTADGEWQWEDGLLVNINFQRAISP